MSTFLIGIIVYLVLINVLSFAAMGFDKRSAKRHKTRLPEALLFELAGVGGGIGVIVGIFAFHHKINKMWFSLPRKREKERASKRCPEVPLAQKELLTLREAAAYTGIGINRLRRMSDDVHCNFVLWSGSKRLLKRRELEKYLAEAYSV